jgi:hypothetical protein
MKHCLTGIILLGLVSTVTAADLRQARPLSAADWELLKERMALVSNISFIPSLLPVIMKNQDALELSEAQVSAFRAWRKGNYQQMVDDMNAIIEKRIALSVKSLNPKVSDAEILQLQNEIFGLQKDVLKLRLGCRKLIMNTFTTNQWTAFRFVIEEYPNLAGLME